MLNVFGDLYGFPVNANDMRALSPTELQKRMNDQYVLMSQAKISPYYAAGTQNFWQIEPEQRPLDERFADFKVRLAAALAKRAV